MARRPRLDEHRIEFRDGGGVLLIVAAFFLFFGFGIILQPADPEDATRNLLFGAAFVIAGVVVALARWGVTLDARSGTLTRWWGLVVPLHSTFRRLDDLERVELTKRVHTSRAGDQWAFSISLVSRARRLKAWEHGSHAEVQRRAEQVAKLLQLPLRDRTGKDVVERDVGQLDESLRQRAERTGCWIERPARQAVLARCEARDVGSEVHVERPPEQVSPRHVVALVVIALLPGLAVPFLFLPGHAELMQAVGFERVVIGVALVVAMLLVVVITVFLSWRALKSVVTHELLVVSSRELRVERRTPLGTRVQVLEAGDIEDVVLAAPGEREREGGRSVFVRTDRVEVQLGEGLLQPELRWLHDTLHAVLTGGRE